MTIPKRPEPGSTLDQALLSLLKGERITHRDHDAETASYRLAARIHQLRKAGWLIESLPEAGFTRTGRKARFVRYAIPRQELRRYRTHPNVKRWLGGAA